MPRYTFQLNDQTIIKAASIVHEHCCDTEFLDLIKEVPQFNDTPFKSDMVAKILRDIYFLEVTIKLYRPAWYWTKAIARADYDKKLIEFNAYKKMELADRIETIFHECCHVIGFVHTGNYVTEHNLRTVPFLASNIFVNYLKSTSII